MQEYDDIPLQFLPLAGENIHGYVVEKLLGEGSFGNVYKVRDGHSQEVFALKMLRLWEAPPEVRVPLLKRFDLEFETGQILSNYLVKTVGRGKISGNPYIVMDYCPNGDLRAFMGRSPRIPENTARKICSEILYGLKDLHRNGKVHRDLKPENILFSRNQVAQLTDFGIAGHANIKFRLTQVNWKGKPMQIFGTIAYMPPEQVRPSNKHVTLLPATDIFSFGVLAFEMLSGRLPFGPLNNEADVAEYFRRTTEGKWEKIHSGLPLVSERIWNHILEKCLCPDYQKRYGSVDDILADLGETAQKGTRDLYPGDCLSLLVMQGEEYGKIYLLKGFPPGSGDNLMTVGRMCESVHNDIAIREEMTSYISRRHATIEKSSDPAQWYIRDGQWITQAACWERSMNGTFVNSMPVGLEGVRLNIDDIITLGDTTLKVIDR